jgi:3-hydroxyacyl-CoA dehydrogenase
MMKTGKQLESNDAGVVNMIRVVAVVGAGAMGRGIAQISAQAGLQVLLFDTNAAVVEKARADIFAQWDKLQQKEKSPIINVLSLNQNYISSMSCRHWLPAIW